MNLSDADNPPVQVNELLNRCMNNSELAKSLLEKFEASLDAYFDALPKDWGVEHCESVHRDAHKLKGAAATVGATSLMDAANELSELARELDVSNAHCAYAELTDEIAEFLSWFHEGLDDQLQAATSSSQPPVWRRPC